MARISITFEHPRTGETRQASVGYSWPLLQFGVLLPLYQRQWKLSLIVLGGAALSFGVSNLILAIYYDKLYVKALVAKGFLARTALDGALEHAESHLSMRLPRHPGVHTITPSP